ncbi:hypothetical protein COBT_003983, partial [Conglomerata obtusa]
MLNVREKQKKKTKPINNKDKIKVGEIVLRKNKQQNDKFAPKYIGPYIVTHKHETGSYLLSDMEKKHNIVEHRKNLKRVASNASVKRFKCNHDKAYEDVTDNEEGRIVEANDVVRDITNSDLPKRGYNKLDELSYRRQKKCLL